MGNTASAEIVGSGPLRRPGTAPSWTPNENPRTESENVHIRAVSDLLTMVHKSSTGKISSEDKTALQTAIQVLNSSRLQKRLAEANRCPAVTPRKVDSQYEVMPFYSNIEEQMEAFKKTMGVDLANQSWNQNHSKATLEHDENTVIRRRRRSLHIRSKSDGVPKHTHQSHHSHRHSDGEVVGKGFGSNNDSSATMTGDTLDDETSKKNSSERKKSVNIKIVRSSLGHENGREISLMRGVSFNTHRTLRSLSIQGNGFQQGRGHTGAYQVDRPSASSLAGIDPSRVPDFDDFRCYIPKTVLKEIFTFTSQGQNSSDKSDTRTRRISVSGRKLDIFTATDPYQRSYEAAVLFADMSGFTALTERLAARADKDGAELLCMALNDFFGIILDIVEL